MLVRTLALTAAAAALTACANDRGMDGADAQPRDFADYESDPRLGQRVDRICFGSQIDGFGETTDDTVLLEAGVDDWYLAHTFNCPDLDYAQSLAFDRFGSCLRQGDSIIAFDSPIPSSDASPAPRGCQIRAIYEWDPTIPVDTGTF